MAATRKSTKRKRGHTKSGRDVHGAPPEPPPPPPPPQFPMGSSARLRPASMLTDALEAQLCLLLEQGSWIETAVAEIGISRSAYYLWRKRGRARKPNGAPNPRYDPRYELFVLRVDAARARSIGLVERRIHSLASGQSSVSEDEDASTQLRAGMVFLETRAAQERAIAESKRAKAALAQTRAATAKTVAETLIIEKFGRTAANIRRDAEEQTANAILDSIRGTVDEDTYERIVASLAGVASRESESDQAPAAAQVPGDHGRDHGLAPDAKAPGEGEEESG